MTSSDIHKALKAHYAARCDGSVYIEEFRAGTGYSPGSERYLDAWVMGTFPSSGLVKTAIEIKVSRSDFTRELRKPIKRDSALRISNVFYFAAPKGLISPAELPVEVGLIEVDEAGFVSVAEEAPYRECERASWVFVASLARRAQSKAARSSSPQSGSPPSCSP
jgi:hypothetical protein